MIFKEPKIYYYQSKSHLSDYYANIKINQLFNRLLFPSSEAHWGKTARYGILVKKLIGRFFKQKVRSFQ